MNVTCETCHRTAEVYKGQGIVATEGTGELWVCWQGWHRAICGDCLKKPISLWAKGEETMPWIEEERT